MELPETVRLAMEAISTPIEVMPCDPAYADTAEFCEHYGVPLDHSANVIIVASKRQPARHVACVVTADRRLDVNHTVKRLMDAGKVSFASADATQDVTGMEIGGVTALGLPDDLPIYVDAAIMDLDWIILGAGTRSAKLKVSPVVFTELAQAQVVEGLARPAPSDG